MYERKFRYFRLRFEKKQENGRYIEHTENPVELFRKLNTLIFRFDPEPNRYYYKKPDVGVYMEFKGNDTDPKNWDDKVRGTLAFARRDGLPRVVHESGRDSNLRSRIEEREALKESVHFVFFKESNTLGLEFHRFSPSYIDFTEYIRNKSDPVIRVKATPCLSQDAMEVLNKVDEVRMLKFRVPNIELNNKEFSDMPIFQALETAAEYTGGDSVEIILRKSRTTENYLSRDFLAALKSIFKKKKQMDLFESMSLTGTGKGGERFNNHNLLKDKLVFSSQFETSTEPNTFAEEVLQKIEETYEDNKSSITG